MPMIGGGDCVGGCIVKMTPGITVAEFPCIRFRKAIAIGGESARRSDQCENGGLDWSGEICPSRDYLRQFGTGRDWISGVYSGVCVRFPFIYGQNIGVRIPLSPPYNKINDFLKTLVEWQRLVATNAPISSVVCRCCLREIGLDFAPFNIADQQDKIFMLRAQKPIVAHFHSWK